MTDLRLRTVVSIDQMLDQLDEAQAGSEEQSRIAEAIVKLYKVCNEDIRVEEEVLNNDTDRQEKRCRVKEMQKNLDKEEKWYEQIKPDTIVTCGTMTFLTMLAFRLEKLGYILPKTLKYVDKLKI